MKSTENVPQPWAAAPATLVMLSKWRLPASPIPFLQISADQGHDGFQRATVCVVPVPANRRMLSKQWLPGPASFPGSTRTAMTLLSRTAMSALQRSANRRWLMSGQTLSADRPFFTRSARAIRQTLPSGTMPAPWDGLTRNLVLPEERLSGHPAPLQDYRHAEKKSRPSHCRQRSFRAAKRSALASPNCKRCAAQASKNSRGLSVASR